ncbi:MAG: NIL domain-containing protein [Gloeomargarita sp. SKYBB_i_bin120]|nr:NIL domain-containing protein [Gloeomargarita sp. SKYB120]MDW8177145.1 NIL domain-containing protein [Gloeomargarita sp. SKYBB_i_bin120]
MTQAKRVTVRVRVPAGGQDEPVLSQLITQYGVTVNIRGALFDPQNQAEAWLDLELYGAETALERCLAVMQERQWELINLSPIADAPEMTVPTPVMPPATTAVQRTHIHVRIPKAACDVPILSGLVSGYGLVVNLRGGLLSPSREDDGWFDLEVQGTAEQIAQGLDYLRQRGIQVWQADNQVDWSV